MKRKELYFIGTACLVAVVIAFSGCKNYPQKAVTSNGTFTAGSSANNYFLFLSDTHLNTNQEETDSGQDAGMKLWNNCKAKLDSIVNSPNPPRFVVFTGDLPAHGIRGVQQEANVTKVLTDLRNLLSPGRIPFFYAPGNNDGLASNYASFANKNGETPFSLIHESVPVFNVAKTNTGNTYLLDTTNKAAGYYAAMATKGLRILCLNSIIWGNRYESADGIPQKDAGDKEMNWLADQLRQANAAGDKVYLAMHIPPGKDAYSVSLKKGDPYMWKTLSGTEPWQNQFLQLIDTFQSTVAGIFFGHTHFDELRLLYDPAGNQLTQVAISCPGISPDHDNNPAFKLVYFDAGKSKLPFNFTTYYSKRNAAVWGNETYRFANVFGTNSGSSIYANLKQMPIQKVQEGLDSIYTTMGAKKQYDITVGLMVKWIK